MIGPFFNFYYVISYELKVKHGFNEYDFTLKYKSKWKNKIAITDRLKRDLSRASIENVSVIYTMSNVNDYLFLKCIFDNVNDNKEKLLNFMKAWKYLDFQIEQFRGEAAAVNLGLI